MNKVSFVEVFKFVGRYWLRIPLMMTVIFIGIAASTALEIFMPTVAADTANAFKGFTDGSIGLEEAAWAAGLLVALIGTVSLIQQGFFRVWMYVASNVMHHIVADAFYRVQRFSSDWHTNSFSGSTVRKISRGMWAYDNLADTLIMDLIPATVILTGLTVITTIRMPLMGIYFGIAVVIFIGVTIVLSLKYVAPANIKSNEADTELGGALADAVTCNVTVKSFGAEVREDTRLYDVAWKWRVAARRSWTRSMDAGAVQSLMILLLISGLFIIVLYEASRGTADVGDVAYVITMYFQVNSYLRNIGWQVRNLQRSINELDDLVEFSRMEPQVANVLDAPDYQPNQGAIEFRNVNFKYENQPAPIFTDFSVNIRAGEKVALVGESGSGKTTFVKLIQRLYDIDEGEIVIDGQNIAEVTQETLRREIALVPQEPILFHRSLADNIAYANEDAGEDQIVEASKKAHAHEFISLLTEGYDTLVGERGIKLSGGERQRVAIARAILADCPILILDEATSSLDSITEHMIQEGITNLMEGRTAIMVAHRLSTVRKADRILVFDKGEVVEQGTHEELMSRTGGTYRALYDMQTLGLIDTTEAEVSAAE